MHACTYIPRRAVSAPLPILSADLQDRMVYGRVVNEEDTKRIIRCHSVRHPAGQSIYEAATPPCHRLVLEFA